MKKLVGLVVLTLLPLCSNAENTRPRCVYAKGNVPDPRRKPGQADRSNPIEHIIVVMQENHSFDNYFGRLNQPQFYGSEVDGVTPAHSNPALKGPPVHAYHESTKCVADPEHGWDAIHNEWNEGRMDGFVKVNGTKAIGYYDQNDLPFYYDIANKFAIGDRYFCSTLTQTFPNRYYLYAATSFGHVGNDFPLPIFQFEQKTIFDTLNEHGVTWKYYKNGPGYLELFQPMFHKNREKIVGLNEFYQDLKNGRLPQVVVIDSAFEAGEDEHPNGNIEVGQAFVAHRLQELVTSRYWKNSVFFLTYDEGGGFYDHVAPPEACVPDEIEPKIGKNSYQARFDRYGVRVPFVAVSPYVRHHYVSHVNYDHASILKFIEDKFNLPALSSRDANADGFTDLFDFAHPDFATKPNFSLAKVGDDCK